MAALCSCSLAAQLLWPALGQQVAAHLDPDLMLDVQSGLSRLRVEPVRGAALPPEAVFESLESQLRSGSLAGAVSTAAVRYQACPGRPGLLEPIESEGRHTVGSFADGVFCPCEGPAA
jgi:hypothetical protein